MSGTTEPVSSVVTDSTGHKEQLLMQWLNADTALRDHQIEHPVCAFPMQRWGCPDWRRLNEAMDNIESQMIDAGMPSPNANIYVGAGGAEKYYADLA